MASAQESADDITPTEFLKKIRDLSEQRDREDAERYAQLEQSIERDREARRARREGMYHIFKLLGVTTRDCPNGKLAPWQLMQG